MIILEKFTQNRIKLEFDDLAYGLLCCVNRNKRFQESNMQGCYSLPGFFEWVDPSQYESMLKSWSTEYGVDLLCRDTYEKELSPFTRK
jgi:hypothetical protein